MKELFTDSQLDKLSDILITVGEVLFASIVAPFFIGFDKANLPVLLSGIGLMAISWVLSISLVKGVEEQ